jgi:invasion protein IalB
MRNIVISLAAVAAISAIAAPAAAEGQQNNVLAAPQDQDGGTANAAPRSRARAAAGGDRVVCMRINPGASRITRRICRTQQEWEERGGDEVIDPR